MKRTSLFALLMCVACAQPRDQATRFGGAEQSVNVFNIEKTRISPYIYRGPARSFTMRETVVLGQSVRTGFSRSRCVYASMLGSFDVYWDGQLIGRSGTATSPGPMDSFFVIPASLDAPGAHALEFRVFLPSLESNWFHGVVIGDYE
jgi:hypothetical protein